MTRTEERLADALSELARGVSKETLPPLTVPKVPGRHWGRRLAPLAAAAAVVLIAVLTLVPGDAGHRPAPGAGTPPRYYAFIQPNQVVVRATSTGAVTARLPGPGDTWSPMSLISAGDGRFIAVYYGSPRSSRGNAPETRLYAFRLTSAGHIAGFAQVKGGVLHGVQPDGYMEGGGGVAVSPDHSKIAVAVCGVSDLCAAGEIVVVNTSTGEHDTWQGGLRRHGLGVGIPSISWAADGRSLVFLAQWCQSTNGCGFYLAGKDYSQVRTLDLAAGGGSLAQGHVLLSESARYPRIVRALLTPGGRSLTLAVLRGPGIGPGKLANTVQVTQVPLGSHGQPRLLYQGPLGNIIQVTMSSDPSGRYWLLSTSSNGWLERGKLHLLPPQLGSGLAVWGDSWQN